MPWEMKKVAKVDLKNPMLIEGLPGVGNVGKIAVDFLIEKLNAKRIYEMSSYELPHCVFVNEENMIELPMIDVYYANIKGRTVLFLAGDIEPTSEKSCYEFCHAILDKVGGTKGLEIVTLGGIALPVVPKNPKVYCTGNSKQIMRKYAATTDTNIHGVVGPIIGVSGVLPGLAGKRSIPSVALLAETFGHPQYLGITGAKEILKVLQKELKIKIDINELEEEESNAALQKRMDKKENKLDLLMPKLREMEETREKEEITTRYIG